MCDYPLRIFQRDWAVLSPQLCQQVVRLDSLWHVATKRTTPRWGLENPSGNWEDSLLYSASAFCQIHHIIYSLPCTCGGIHPEQVESASPMGTISIDDASWVVGTPRSSVPASLHYLGLQLKPTLPDLRAQKRPLFTPSLLVSIQVTQRGRKGYGPVFF